MPLHVYRRLTSFETSLIVFGELALKDRCLIYQYDLEENRCEELTTVEGLEGARFVALGLLGVLERSIQWRCKSGEHSGTFWRATWFTLIGRISTWKPLAETSRKFRLDACVRASCVLGAAAHTDWLSGFLRVFLSWLGLFRRASSRALSALGRNLTAVPVSITAPAFERWTSYHFFFGSMMNNYYRKMIPYQHQTACPPLAQGARPGYHGAKRGQVDGVAPSVSLTRKICEAGPHDFLALVATFP
ncbi:unnamed protein product [Schistocephalus solidus]|uniref:Uncharacterized protein n=1 Tax=Schistocephalus solidus TaxID=70667 RepID=A0A183SFQ2_SCHSO|nr:unnamed protein product [Schistocephalus solidus]